MRNMFYDCPSLKGLNLNNFNTNNVNNMNGMFYNCSKDLKMNMKALSKFKDEAFK